MRSFLGASLCLLLLAGCSIFDFSKPVAVDHPRVTLPSGLEYEDELAGLGPPARPGQLVNIDYTAWLASDGTLIDSTLERGTPVGFVLGDAPIEGWNEGIAGMSAGGRRRLYVPSALAYGAQGVPGLIPPNAALVFLVQLVSIAKAPPAQQ